MPDKKKEKRGKKQSRNKYDSAWKEVLKKLFKATQTPEADVDAMMQGQ
ncbi:MAG: hypothetical protein ACM3SY_06800 [Candidatus Omnitrophota bacterium]